MVALANTTTASDLIVPQVWGDALAAKIPFSIKYRPFVTVDYTLQGQPGDTVTYAQWDYIGDADDVAELADIPLTKLGAETSEASIKKAGKGIGFSDESILNASGNPTAEGNRQLVQSIAQKVDKDVHAEAFSKATYSVAEPFSITALLANIDKFGEWEPEQFAGLVLSPKAYTALIGHEHFLSAAEAGQPSTLATGKLASLLGIPVSMSNRATTGALLIEKGALGLLLKRDVLVEKDRDIVNKSTIVTADMHYAATVPRPSGLMKFAADA